MRLAIDIGGTFTDLVLYDDQNKQLHRAKTPTTPEDQSIGLGHGIELICAMTGADPASIDIVLHGTTVATNAVLEGRGARVGLLLTEGFEYTLHLAKSWTPGPLFGWINMKKPEPLAKLLDTRGIKERILANGEVSRPLDLEHTRDVLDELCTSGIEALTISLMHSYSNQTHELQIAEMARQRHPDIPVSLSSEILPEFREYDRAITTVMNAYVRPVMQKYLSRVEKRIVDCGIRSRVHIVRSDGGVMSTVAAAERPVHTILSGPSGGVTSAAAIANSTGYKNLLAFDMGGTSTDVSVILDGHPKISRSTEVGYFPAKVAALDVRSVGAGGGSVASVSELTNALRVGPNSAGSVPGPIAYGKGGTEVTVTDANLVLGHLPTSILGGEMLLDVKAARKSISSLGRQLGLNTEETAMGILDIANETMLGALRVVTVQRGLDPRDFAIVGFGGAGPLHANSMAKILGCYPVIIPQHPGVLSALGFLQAKFRNEFIRTFIRTIDKLAFEEFGMVMNDLHEKAIEWLDHEKIPENERIIKFNIDMRYEQQGFEITVEIQDPDSNPSSLVKHALEAFHAEHMRLYNVNFDVPVELVAMRAIAIGMTPEVEIKSAAPENEGEEAIIEIAPAYFEGGWLDTPHYNRERLRVGQRITGPAVVRQYDSTIVIFPDHYAEIDRSNNILIWPVSEGTN